MDIKQYNIPEIASFSAGQDINHDIVESTYTHVDIKPLETVTIDIDQIKAEAFECGRQSAADAIAAKKLSHQAVTNQILQQIEMMCKSFADEFAKSQKDLINDSIALSLAIAKKVIGPFIANTASTMIKDFLSKNLPLLYSEPKIIIKVCQEHAAEIQQHVANIQKTIGSSLSIEVISVDMLQGDCSVEFSGAKICKNSMHLFEKIETFLHSYYSAIKEPIVSQQADLERAGHITRNTTH